jgi:succinate dehydrogenase / fumarate reductase, cytochrome b subunit
MRRVFSLYDSSVGKKIVMAVTGTILVLFVIAHMFGNLKVYQGPEAFNKYAEGLRVFGDPFVGRGDALWLARIVLLLAVVLHIAAATQLVLRSKAARKVGYKTYESDLIFSYASRTMVWGGIIVLAFVVFHILHLTTGTVHPSFDHEDAYHNFVAGFRVWPVSLAYIAAMIPLGFHLYHGIWSAFQTLGANNPRYNDYRRPLAILLALAVVVGNISFPVAVLTGIID